MNLVSWKKIVQSAAVEYEGAREYIVTGIGRVVVEERDVATAALLGGDPVCVLTPANFTYNPHDRYFHIRSFWKPDWG